MQLRFSDGDLLGAAGVAAVAFSAVPLNLAAAAWRDGAHLRAFLGATLWLLLALYAAGNAVKFSAYHRAETASACLLAANRYGDGQEDLQAARERLKELKSHPAYGETEGCTRITGREVRALYGAFFLKGSILAPLSFFVVVYGVHGLSRQSKGEPAIAARRLAAIQPCICIPASPFK